MGDWERSSQNAGRLLLQMLALAICCNPALIGLSGVAQTPQKNGSQPQLTAMAKDVAPAACPTPPLPNYTLLEAVAALPPDAQRAVESLRQGETVLIYGPEGSGRRALARDMLNALQTAKPDAACNLWAQLDSDGPGLTLADLDTQLCRQPPAYPQEPMANSALHALRTQLVARQAAVVIETTTVATPHLSPLLCGLQPLPLIVVSSQDMPLPCTEHPVRVSPEAPGRERCVELFAAHTEAASLPSQRPAVEALCSQVEHDPLTITVAAHQYRSAGRPIDTPATDGLGPPEPKTKARDPLDAWVERGLAKASSAGKRAFASLGVFPAGTDIPEAPANAAAGINDARVWRQLATQGLLQWDDRNRVLHQHPRLRQQARTRLAQREDQDAIWQRLIRQQQAQLVRARFVPSSRLHADILERLRVQAQDAQPTVPEHDRQLVLWAIDLGQRPLFLATGPDTVERWLQSALEAARRLEDSAASARLALLMGERLAAAGRADEVLSWLQTALAKARTEGDPALQGLVLDRLGQAQSRYGRLERAVDHFTRAYAMATAAQDPRAQGLRLGHLAQAYLDQGESRLALANLDQAVRLARETGDRHQEALDLNLLGIAYRDLGAVQQAIQMQQQAVKLARALNDEASEASFHLQLAESYRAIGQLQHAIAQRRAGLQLARRSGLPALESQLLSGLGDLLFDLHDYPQATATYELALALCRTLEDHVGESNLLVNLANTQRARREPQAALPYYEAALEVATRLGDRHGQGTLHEELADTYLELNTPKKAISELQQALHLARAGHDAPNEARRLKALSAAYSRQGDEKQAERHRQRALALLEHEQPHGAAPNPLDLLNH